MSAGSVILDSPTPCPTCRRSTIQCTFGGLRRCSQCGNATAVLEQADGFVPLNPSYALGDAKLTNPKAAIGSNKLPLSLFPATAIALGSIGMANGLCKYGRDNFRVSGVQASTYVDAAMRHLLAWNEGEECDPDDGVPHLAAALSCLAIIVDARAAGKLNDDRKVEGGYHALVAELTPHVARLRELHATKTPHHYTIADNQEGAEW